LRKTSCITAIEAFDRLIAVDMLRVFALVASGQHYPNALGYEKHFERIVRAWRPVLAEPVNAGPG
jgi:hypothetical protein